MANVPAHPPPATILFAGGGTGGHLFPGIAVAEALRELDPAVRCVFVGSGREIERRLAADHGLEHRALAVEPSTAFRRNPVRFAWRYWGARRAARRLVDELRPAAVVGLGGFASVPVVGAANVPVVLLEQNAVPGRATRWLAKRASLICLSFEESRAGLPRTIAAHVTGNPVRREIAALRDDGRARSANESRMLLVLGGSQGAAALNEAVPRAIAELRAAERGWRIVHQAGMGNEAAVREAYRAAGVEAEVAEFFADLPERVAAASLAVSRAGGTTLAELACAACPTILVPYPGAIADHQSLNARAFERAGGARVVEQADTPAETAGRLSAALREPLDDADRLARMSAAMRALARPRAARDIATAVLQLARR
ncbi:MAG: undecaprenyldiphospho-muramoylpentapeptide beta-N-acetylglucosaminyltransferase [Planctomycetaceae bacterium]